MGGVERGGTGRQWLWRRCAAAVRLAGGRGAEADTAGSHFADHDTPTSPIATRQMVLSPGQCRLVVAGDGGPLSADVMCNGATQHVASGASVVIAAGCPLQRIALYATASSGTVRSAALTR